MKRRFSKVLSLLLCLAMMLSTVVIGVSAESTSAVMGHIEMCDKNAEYSKSGAVVFDESTVKMGNTSVKLPIPAAGNTVTAARSFTAVDYSNAEYLSVWV